MYQQTISTRPSVPTDMPAANHAQAPQEPNQRMQPPRKGALPYTREEYRALPADRKSAALDFIIEGIIPNIHGTGGEDAVQSVMDNIVDWCIAHGEDTALEFLFRESGATRMPCIFRTLDQRAFMLMRHALRSHPQIELHFSGLSITENAASALAELIREGRVATLSLDCKNLSDTAICLIAKALQSNTTITRLNLRECKTLSRDVAETLGDALRNNTSIGRLEFSGCDFGTGGWEFMFEALESNRYAKELALRFCDLESEGSAAACGRLLANSATLKTFTIWADRFDGIAGDILGGLGRNRSIKKATIDAEDHVLEHTGAALSDCIARNTFMERFEFYTAVPLACPDALVRNTSLLSLESNLFTKDEGEDIVANTLQRNAALANDAYMRNAAAIFTRQPFGAHSWLPEGPSDTLARHILMQQDSIADFAETMAHVELAAKEQS